MSAKILGNVARHCIEAGKVQGKAKWVGEDKGEWKECGVHRNMNRQHTDTCQLLTVRHGSWPQASRPRCRALLGR
eukprot:11752202-Alexandrium_andersonii.AAC.1